MKKILRLLVMTQIKHSEEYYQKALKSQGINYEDLTHNEIALWKAIMKQVEADLLIEAAYDKEKTSRKDFDYSILIKQATNVQP